jgi:hypothetical protein
MGKIVSIAAVMIAASLACAHAQTPVSELAKPPENARHLTISSTGGKHGDSWIWRDADGTLRGRESMNLRGQIFETDSAYTFAADGALRALTVRGFTPQGDIGETFSVENGVARWKSPVDAGQTGMPAKAFYAALGGPMATAAAMFEALIASPEKKIALLPGGAASAEKLTTLEVGQGAAKQTVTAWALTGISTSPVPVWGDANGRFFGVTFGLSWLPEGFEGERARLEKAQTEALAARMPAMAKALAEMPTGPVAFKNVRIFDAVKRHFVDDQTVVVVGDRIKAVGPSSQVAIPKGARVIDGAGKTLVPGLWDCHMHVGDDYTGVQELSLGVTSVRDPGNDDVRTVERRGRIARGELLFPNVYASSLIDGKGPNTAQVANVATSQDEAIALMRKAKANGLIGVKFYGTLNPAWLKASVDEAPSWPARAWAHSRGHPPARCRERRIRRDHAHQLDHHAGRPGRGDQGVEWDRTLRGAGAVREGREFRCRTHEIVHRDARPAQGRVRSDDGGVRGSVRAREWRSVAGLRAVCRHHAADDGARIPPRRVCRAEGPDACGLSQELGQAGRAAAADE